MIQLAGILALLIAAVLIVADAHGADMGKQAMIEPAGAKLLSLLLKYPLLVAAAVGSIIGSLVVSSYQKKNRVQQFLVNFSIAICLTPAVFTLLETPVTWERWLACALVLGIVSGTILQWWIDPTIQAALKRAVAHQIDERIGESEEKAKE